MSHLGKIRDSFRREQRAKPSGSLFPGVWTQSGRTRLETSRGEAVPGAQNQKESRSGKVSSQHRGF